MSIVCQQSKPSIGVVLLPFLSEGQLRGFHAKELVDIPFSDFKRIWKDMKLTLENNFNNFDNGECSISAMNSHEKDNYFDSDVAKYYEGEEYEQAWLSNYDKIIPLRPFVALDGCQKFTEKLNEKSDLNALWEDNIEDGNGYRFTEESGKNLVLTATTRDRNLTFKNIEVRKVKGENLINLSIDIGLKSPYIEVVRYGRYLILLNGHHRLFALKKMGYSEVPCIILDNEPYIELLESNPYAGDLKNGYLVPRFEYFFDGNLTANFSLQKDIRQLKITLQEEVIPTIIGTE
ncbi:MAG TPA: hypothetical protein VFV52_01840 [Bacilli bacterium]|nr:hypothetical protein [Bacilli bacterium]